jgi:peptidoglycan/LPS O-acetylase OafA/YrhL
MDGARTGGSRYIFLDYLRAAAAWLVVWDHLVASLPQDLGKPLPLAIWVRHNISGPLGIIQDFGWFGVAVFLLISGFIISDRAAVESTRTFVIRRILRIYPMMIVAVLLTVAIGGSATPSLQTILLNMTLASYLRVPQIVLVGVAWTLVIEMVFYAITAATQVMRSSPHRIAINLVLVGLVIFNRGAFGPSFGLFANVVSYLPILVMGQIIYWWLERGRLSAFWGFGYLAAASGLFLLGVRAVNAAFEPVTNSYVISVAYAVLLFLVLRTARLPESRIVRFLSETSYSLYLMHGIVGYRLLGVLLPRIGAPAAVALAIAASLASASLTYLLVERPTLKLARRLTSPPPPRGLPESAPAAL